MERGRRSSENASAAPAPVAAIHSGTLPVIVAGVRVVLSDTSVTTAAGVNSSVRSTTSPRASMTALTPLVADTGRILTAVLSNPEDVDWAHTLALYVPYSASSFTDDIEWQIRPLTSLHVRDVRVLS